MKKILVIGSSGFVGSHLTKQLIAEGYSVRCLARNPDKFISDFGNSCEIVKGDISDALSVYKALESMDAVYISIHTLAPQQAGTADKSFMEIEINGLENIVKGCQLHQVNRLIYVTAIGVSADKTDPWTSGRWKAQQFLLNSKLDVTIIQPGMIVGIGGQGFNMVLMNAQKRVAFVVGNGRNKFRCIAIDDLAYNLVGVLNEPHAYGKIYEVGSDDVLSMDQLIDSAADLLGHRHPLKIHIPLGLIRFAAPLIQRIAKSPRGAIKGVLDGLGADMIGNPSAIRVLLPKKPLTYKKAVEAALMVYQKKTT